MEPRSQELGAASDTVGSVMQELTAQRLGASTWVGEHASNTPDAPKPWMRLPWHKRLLVVPYLWLLVALDWFRRVFLGLRWLLKTWTKQHPGATTQSAETTFWPLFFVALCQWANPGNPFFLNEGFPWPWVGVWLIALRYGVLSGLVGALLLLTAWYGLRTEAEFPRLYFLGGGIMTLIAGEFGSLWGGRSENQKNATRYLEDKIDRLTRRLYLLKLSHDELEYEMVERPATLRDALAELQTKLNFLVGSRDSLPGAQVMLDFLAAHCQIESGAIYAYIDGPNPRMARAAYVGNAHQVAAMDPMVRRAVETGQAVHLLDQLSQSASHDQVLVVCPMQNDAGDVAGVLTVHRLPFMAFNADNLRNLGVLLDAYSAYLRLRAIARPLLLQWPSAPIALVNEYGWLQRMHVVHGISSGCLLWTAQGQHAAKQLEVLLSVQLDGSLAWRIGPRGSLAVISLVPFLSNSRLRNHEQQVRLRLGQRIAGTGEFTDNMLHCEFLDLADASTWLSLRSKAGAA